MDIQSAPGDDIIIETTVTNPDGSIRDLSGASASCAVYDAPTGAQLFTGVAALTDAANGELSFTFDSSTTDDYVGEIHVLFWSGTIHETSGEDTRVDSGRLVLA